jgi:hypothetical protein
MTGATLPLAMRATQVAHFNPPPLLTGTAAYLWRFDRLAIGEKILRRPDSNGRAALAGGHDGPAATVQADFDLT